MKLNPVKSNMTEIETGKITILFSYKTPVAYRVNETGEYFKTDKHWSVTTSRHINQWIGDSGEATVGSVSQDDLDNLLNEVK
jgi:hypothetical protein